MTDSRDEKVLVISGLIRQGQYTIESITFEQRTVYSNTKGSYIKNREYGTVYLDNRNRAFLFKEIVRSPRGNTLRRIVTLDQIDTQPLQNSLDTQLQNYGL